MLRFGVADEMRILLAVVVLPLGEQLVAVAVAKLVQKLVGAVLNGAVAEGIHPNADGQASERIMVFGARQHRSLIAQPPDVAEKSKHHQRGDANSNTDLYASEPHPERKFIWSETSRKITAGSRDGTCTYGGVVDAARKQGSPWAFAQVGIIRLVRLPRQRRRARLSPCLLRDKSLTT